MTLGLRQGLAAAVMAAFLLLAAAAGASAAPAISVSDPSIDEPDVQNELVRFEVSLSEPAAGVVTVDFATANGTAVYGSTGQGDYFRRLSTTLTFTPGQTRKTVDVYVLPDAHDEPDETFHLDLTGAVGATIADSRGTATIADDDAPPAVSVSDLSIDEPDSSNELVRFTVSLSAPSGKTVSVDFATANGTAAYGATGQGDYFRRTTTTLTFTPGQTSRTVDVWVLPDARDEFDETFHIDLANPTGDATIAGAQGTATIVDDDAPPSVSVADVYANEVAGQNELLRFEVSLSAPSGKTVSVDFATADGSARFGAQGQGDYFRRQLGTLTFSPGQTRRTIDVWVLHDSLDEPPEDFFLDLSNATEGVTIARSRGTATIYPQPRISVSDVTIDEPDSQNELASFQVSLSNPSTRTVTVDFATADGTAVYGAQGQGDYFRRTATTLSFAPGQTTKTVDVYVLPDARDEVDETFSLDVANPTGGASVGDGQGTATIADDDAPPEIAVNDVSVDEPADGNRLTTFEVTLSAASGRTVTVDFATTNGTAGFGSTGQGDYFRRQPSTLTFSPGQTRKTVDVYVLPDSRDEFDETFHLDLSNVTGGATLADARGTATIADEDPAPTMQVSDAGIDEPDGDPENASVAVTLSAASEKPITVQRGVSDGSATAADYDAPAPAQIGFAPGETSHIVRVPVRSDALDEDDETFHVDLAGATNAGLADTRGTVTIADDDAPPAISVSDVAIDEPDTANEQAAFTVSLSAPSGRPVTTTAQPVDGTATAGADWVSQAPSLLTFAPGETSKTVQVAVRPDALDEFDETFHLDLGPVVAATASSGRGTATIADDDAAPSVSISDVAVTEPASGQTTATAAITLSAPSGKAVTVTRATADGSATAGSDYTAASGQIVIPPGSTSANADVAVLSDDFRELLETFDQGLSAAENATVADGGGTVTIAANCHDREPQTFYEALGIGSVSGDVGEEVVTSAAGASICAGDEDWFRFQLREDSTASGDVYLSADVELEVPDAVMGGDLDLYVYDEDGSYFDSSEGSGTADEKVFYWFDDSPAIDTSWVYVAVIGYPDPVTGQPAANDYTLRVTGNTSPDP
ncbi:MAG: hypothetical protein M3340_02270 [Actinomycetota bacterium]|nr:hypothetical protein [Actinomycetota bacterium]